MNRDKNFRDLPNLPGQTSLHHNVPFFAAVHESVTVRTPPRGSDRVRSTGYCQFSNKNSPTGFCPTAAKGGLRPKGCLSVLGDLTSYQNFAVKEQDYDKDLRSLACYTNKLGTSRI